MADFVNTVFLMLQVYQANGGSEKYCTEVTFLGEREGDREEEGEWAVEMLQGSCLKEDRKTPGNIWSEVFTSQHQKTLGRQQTIVI